MTTELLYGEFIFDAVLTEMYAIKIAVCFYKVQYERKKTMFSVLCIRVCFKLPLACFGHELAKLHDI